MATTEYIREYRNRRKQEALDYLGNKCIKCGARENLEFDHIDPETKSFQIGGFSGSKTRLLQELDKCQLLCNECHKAKTKMDMAVNRECGTYKKYRFDGCRCEDCTEANREARRRWDIAYRGRP